MKIKLYRTHPRHICHRVIFQLCRVLLAKLLPTAADTVPVYQSSLSIVDSIHVESFWDPLNSSWRPAKIFISHEITIVGSAIPSLAGRFHAKPRNSLSTLFLKLVSARDKCEKD